MTKTLKKNKYLNKNKSSMKISRKNVKRKFRSKKLKGGSFSNITYMQLLKNITPEEREQYLEINEPKVFDFLNTNFKLTRNEFDFKTLITVDLSGKLDTLNTDKLLSILAYEFIRLLTYTVNFDVSNNNLNTKIRHLTTFIPTRNLKSLNISNNDLGLKDNETGTTGCNQIYHLLYERPNTIEILDISNNNIGDAGADIISRILNHDHDNRHNKNNTLTSLNISNNNISTIGGTKIGKALENNKILKILNISNNKCGDKIVQSISVGLKTQLPLTTLDISYNNITDLNMINFIKALNINKTLTLVNIGNNNISTDNINKIETIMKARKNPI